MRQTKGHTAALSPGIALLPLVPYCNINGTEVLPMVSVCVNNPHDFS